MNIGGIGGTLANSGFQFNSNSHGLRPIESGSAFAADIVHRAGGVSPTQPNAPTTPDIADNTTTNKQEHAAKLQDALAGFVAYMDSSFGDKAATAAMGLVYKSIGDSPVTEESLGQALLDVVRFVDTHFGTDAGDAVIGKLNQSLNNEMNDYFDNGSNESFLVATTVSGNTTYSSGVSVMMPQKPHEQESGGGESMLDILKSAAKNLQNSLRRPKKRLGEPANPYDAAMAFTPAPGVMTDMVV